MSDSQRMRQTQQPSQSQGWEAFPPIMLAESCFAFERVAANEIQRILGLDFRTTIGKYSWLLGAYAFVKRFGFDSPYYTLRDGVNEDNVVAESYRVYQRFHQSTPHTYDETEYSGRAARFGCFSYEFQRQTQTVQIHFANNEANPTQSPLAPEARPRREKELHDLFSLIKHRHPQAALVRGDSWIYNHPHYRALFPQSYIPQPAEESKSELWSTDGVWGQFVDHAGQPRVDAQRTFLARLRSIPSGLPHAEALKALRDALPNKPIPMRGPISDIYERFTQD